MLRRDSDSQQAAILGHGHSSFRVFYFPSSGQGIRIRVWRCFMSSRMFLYVPTQSTKSEWGGLVSTHYQARNREGIQPVRSDDSASEEPSPSRRGSILDNLPPSDIPQPQNDVLAPSSLSYCRPRYIFSAAIPTA